MSGGEPGAEVAQPARIRAVQPHQPAVTITSASLPSALDSAASGPDGANRPRPGSRRPGPNPRVGPHLPRIQRPAGLARAARPGEVPEPQHRHLPGWARRLHGQARPILADLLGSLEGEARERFAGRLNELIAGVNAGRFSLMWQYPQLIDEGWSLLQRGQREAAAAARRRQAVEVARRKVSEQLRDVTDRIGADAASRLHRGLRSAGDLEAVASVGREVEQAASSARSVEERRRDREIHRTRERLRRSLPGGDAEEQDTAAETWQDALRRIAAQYTE